MKARFSQLQTLALGLAVVCLCPPWSSQGAGAESNAAAAQGTIPQSIFIIPSTPKEGRNPFFPQSATAAPPLRLTEAPLDTSGLVLNGITSPPKRTAMINGRTFEPGEEADVKMPSGAKVLIKCEEIRAESAVILIMGQRRELRLRAGF
jgi:hypothetical protein